MNIPIGLAPGDDEPRLPPLAYLGDQAQTMVQTQYGQHLAAITVCRHPYSTTLRDPLPQVSSVCCMGFWQTVKHWHLRQHIREWGF